MFIQSDDIPGLAFGTAGLRARMGAGFSCINCLTIIQTSQGLAKYLLKEHNNAQTAGVVIGYDARHYSKHFAELAAAAFIAKGIKVWWYEDLVHTPMVPFAVQHLSAAAGVMITASHNPGQDNGYKVYGSNGCQINSPVDEKIAAFILESLEPITWNIQYARTSKLWVNTLASMTDQYMRAVWDFIDDKEFSSLRALPAFVYTPMHGVGLKYMQQAMDGENNPPRAKGQESIRMIVVEEQAQPDPDFPTVKFPNPEEDGALDLAKVAAESHGITLIVANDPDADRLAIAERVDGNWIQFTGDQVGVLIANYLISQRPPIPSSSPTTTPGTPAQKESYMLSSAVSSQFLSRLTTAYGISHLETLTGFKNLGKLALSLSSQDAQCLFAYEEALGYMFPSVVRDKDGILAAAVFLTACAQWGNSPWQELQMLYQRFGYYETMNTYWKSSNLDATREIFDRIRLLGEPHPQVVAGRTVERWRDLTVGYDSGTADHKSELPSSSDSQMITCWLSAEGDDEGVRLTVRASGTEPKIKSEWVFVHDSYPHLPFQSHFDGKYLI